LRKEVRELRLSTEARTVCIRSVNLTPVRPGMRREHVVRDPNGRAAASLGQRSAVSRELVSYAHGCIEPQHAPVEVQLGKRTITVLPDLLRHCPTSIPTSHHLFVSIGGAMEDLGHAARKMRRECRRPAGGGYTGKVRK
jgi:hypothetical protein